MKISAVFSHLTQLYVEAAPLIYYVEEHPVYVDRMEQIIAIIDNTPMGAVSSVISLTEVLNQPLRMGRVDLEQAYRNILLSGQNFRLLIVSEAIAENAAHLRARYNLRTPDALHVATAIDAKCDAFLTNDKDLRRVTDINVIVLNDLELDSSSAATE